MASPDVECKSCVLFRCLCQKTRVQRRVFEKHSNAVLQILRPAAAKQRMQHQQNTDSDMPVQEPFANHAISFQRQAAIHPSSNESDIPKQSLLAFGSSTAKQTKQNLPPQSRSLEILAQAKKKFPDLFFRNVVSKHDQKPRQNWIRHVLRQKRDGGFCVFPYATRSRYEAVCEWMSLTF